MELTYQTVIWAAGTQFTCVEGYESVHQRMREAAFRMDADDDEFSGMTWADPLEITVRASDGAGGSVPVRCAIQPHTISAVMDIPEDQRETVELADEEVMPSCQS